MTTEALDSADVDALLELVRSRGYALVAKRIDETLARKRLDLEGTGNVPRLRGEIAGLLVALAIPGYLVQEIRGALKE